MENKKKPLAFAVTFFPDGVQEYCGSYNVLLSALNNQAEFANEHA